MKVILKKDMESLGASGEVVDVKPGYARNYLLPQGLAYEASEANVRRLEEEKARAEERAKRDYLEARRRASQMDHVRLLFHAQAGEAGKLFGSVTAADIADRLNEQGFDFEIDRRWIQLAEPLKQVGSYDVVVRLHPDVEIDVGVEVHRADG